MSKQIEISVEQTGDSSSIGRVRGHEVEIDRPEAKGGSDQGPMGGELLLLALGGCFMSNLLAAIKTRESDISDASVKVTAVIDGTPERMTSFDVVVDARYDDPEEMRKLATIAARGCLVSNTLSEAAPVNVRVGAERRIPDRPPSPA